MGSASLSDHAATEDQLVKSKSRKPKGENFYKPATQSAPSVPRRYPTALFPL